jgi:GntR family transcriptional regulator
MNIAVDYSSELPMYEQIEKEIKNLIIDGKLRENDMLPSVRGLSKELNISTITIKRAYLDLEKEGITYSVTGVGTFIKLKEKEELAKENREILYVELKEMINKFLEEY